MIKLRIFIQSKTYCFVIKILITFNVLIDIIGFMYTISHDFCMLCVIFFFFSFALGTFVILCEFWFA